MIWAGLAAVIIQRASAVWAAAVLALATDPSSLHPAVIADVMESPTWEQRGMGRGGVQKERNSKLRIEKDFCCLAVALQSVGQNSA